MQNTTTTPCHENSDKIPVVDTTILHLYMHRKFEMNENKSDRFTPPLPDISEEGDDDNSNKNIHNDGGNVDVNIELLMKNMSIYDLIGQMSQIDICKLLYANASTSNDVDAIVNGTAIDYYIGKLGIGSVYNFIESGVGRTATASWTAVTYRSIMIHIQNAARRYHRPPVLWGLDSIHGSNFIYGSIVSPQPLNIAATFNRSTSYMVGQLSSRDTRAAGLQWIFTPLLGLGIESRWSRFYETFGEDPLVVGTMASNMIQGIQQYEEDDDDDHNNNTKNIPSRAAACAKHYIGYSKPLNGRDRSPSWIPTRHLYQYFVPPWIRVLHKDVNVLTIMESYTEVDGVPMVANTAKLNTLLRHQLNFTGVLLTDFQEMEHLYSWHHMAKNMSDAISYSLERGSVDVSMIPFDVENFTLGIEFGLHMNRFTESRLRESVRRVLQLKKELRMFEETITLDNNHNLNRIGTDEGNMLDIAHQSIILVQNKNSFLPIATIKKSLTDRPTTIKILITGPTSNSRIYQSGGWVGHWQGAPDEQWFKYGSTVYSAFQQKSMYNVSYTCGTDILGQDCQNSNETSTLTSIDRAVEVSQEMDVVIICLGEENYAEKPGDLVQDDLHLPNGQYNLVKEIAFNKSSATKIVLVYFGGRPRLLGSIVDLVDAVVIGFLPGPSAGDAIVNIVSGAVNPSGRLPITYPIANIGGYPYYHSISDQCIVGDGKAPHYEYSPCNVQWPFGHGLSYTTFQYSNLIAERDGNLVESDLHVSVLVRNVGSVPGAETVLVFTFDEYRRTTPEYKRLRAFEKVFLQPNEVVMVNVTIPSDDFRFVGPQDDHHFISDPQMSYWVGIGASTDCRQLINIESNSDSLCAYIPARPETRSSNIGACNAACDIWIHQSGCSDHFSVTFDSCLSMCTSINALSQDSSSMVREGWGWNYVNCIESVVVGLKQQHATSKPSSASECWKMTALCRDIFHTPNLDEYGIAPRVNENVVSLPPMTYILALLAALVSTSFISYSFRRRTRLERRLSHENRRPIDEADDIPYQRLEDLDKERERQLIASTMSLIGLD